MCHVTSCCGCVGNVVTGAKAIGINIMVVHTLLTVIAFAYARFFPFIFFLSFPILLQVFVLLGATRKSIVLLVIWLVLDMFRIVLWGFLFVLLIIAAFVSVGFVAYYGGSWAHLVVIPAIFSGAWFGNLNRQFSYFSRINSILCRNEHLLLDCCSVGLPPDPKVIFRTLPKTRQM